MESNNSAIVKLQSIINLRNERFEGLKPFIIYNNQANSSLWFGVVVIDWCLGDWFTQKRVVTMMTVKRQVLS